MPTKKESKVVGSLQNNCLNIGKTAAANIIKNEASIRKGYEKFKGDLKRNRKGQFNDISDMLTSGLKNVVQQISILTDQCWKKKPWK